MDLDLSERTALVMGASRGIGRGIALALSAEGARVAISSRSEDALGAVAGEMKGPAAVLPADTADLDRLSRLPGEVADALGPVDILVCNTGGPPGGGALDNDLDAWRAAYDSLVLAPRVLSEAVLPSMRERGWGRIVNVASSSVREPIPTLALSNIHRVAAASFFKTLSDEVAADGVTVNTVATGMFATDRLADLYGSMDAAESAAADQIPAGRLGRPEEYGELVAFLCSARAAYLTGAIVPLDGGRLSSL